MTDEPKSRLAKTYRVDQGKGLFIDDEMVPWYIALDPPWRVQPLNEHMHILWLPVLVDGPVPEYGEPDGEPLPTEEPA